MLKVYWCEVQYINTTDNYDYTQLVYACKLVAGGGMMVQLQTF